MNRLFNLTSPFGDALRFDGAGVGDRIRLRARADSGLAFEAQVEAALDGLADHLERHVDLDRLREIAVLAG